MNNTLLNSNPSYKLLVETHPNEVLVERTSNKSSSNLPIIMKGVFMEAGKRNNNGRVYDLASMSAAVDKFQSLISSGGALSELEHPESTDINPDRACARITSLTRSGNKFMGEAVVLAADPERGILGTPCGTLVASLLQYGTKMGWSSRGLGELDNNDIVRNFHIVTVDCVLQPSTGYKTENNATRYIDGILESTDYVIKNHLATEPIFESLRTNVAKLPRKSDDKHEKIRLALNAFFNDITYI